MIETNNDYTYLSELMNLNFEYAKHKIYIDIIYTEMKEGTSINTVFNKKQYIDKNLLATTINKLQKINIIDLLNTQSMTESCHSDSISGQYYCNQTEYYNITANIFFGFINLG